MFWGGSSAPLKPTPPLLPHSGLSKSLESISEWSILRHKPRFPPFRTEGPSRAPQRRFSDLPTPLPSSPPQPEYRSPKATARIPNPALPSWALPKAEAAGAKEKEQRGPCSAPKGAGGPPLPGGPRLTMGEIEKKIKEVRDHLLPCPPSGLASKGGGNPRGHPSGLCALELDLGWAAGEGGVVSTPPPRLGVKEGIAFQLEMELHKGKGDHKEIFPAPT